MNELLPVFHSALWVYMKGILWGFRSLAVPKHLNILCESRCTQYLHAMYFYLKTLNVKVI